MHKTKTKTRKKPKFQWIIIIEWTLKLICLWKVGGFLFRHFSHFFYLVENWMSSLEFWLKYCNYAYFVDSGCDCDRIYIYILHISIIFFIISTMPHSTSHSCFLFCLTFIFRFIPHYIFYMFSSLLFSFFFLSICVKMCPCIIKRESTHMIFHVRFDSM